MLSRRQVFTNVIILLVATASCDTKERDGYGKSWLLFIDEENNTHIMNFSQLPDSGMRLGKPYFQLYTRCNREFPELLTIPIEKGRLNSTYLKKNNDIKVVTHGWLSNGQTTWLQNVKDLLLMYYDVNVLIVDWGQLAKNPAYPWPALCTRYVGKQIAKLLNACTESYGIGRDRIHLIGHSLGAHVMGYAGMFMNSEVHRITGLDPARPLFEFPLLPKDFRLEKSDARFVDIIHTCGGYFGYKYSQGHADFYPNGGKCGQPGCPAHRELIDSCSHGRSVVYFNESILYTKNRGFTAYPCESWKSFENGLCTMNKTTMGYLVGDVRGDYYLHTKNASKYAIFNENYYY